MSMSTDSDRPFHFADRVILALEALDLRVERHIRQGTRNYGTDSDVMDVCDDWSLVGDPDDWEKMYDTVLELVDADR
jgi:hypothetical protein